MAGDLGELGTERELESRPLLRRGEVFTLLPLIDIRCPAEKTGKSPWAEGYVNCVRRGGGEGFGSWRQLLRGLSEEDLNSLSALRVPKPS